MPLLLLVLAPDEHYRDDDEWSEWRRRWLYRRWLYRWGLPAALIASLGLWALIIAGIVWRCHHVTF